MYACARKSAWWAVAAVLALSAGPAMSVPLTTIRVASGLTNPLYAVSPPGDVGRLFIVQQNGQIRILDLVSGSLLPAPFATITVNFGGERGLLGLAFHPDYADNGYFYVNYSRPGDGATVVARYKVMDNDPNRADPNSAFILLTVSQPFSNHNGGWVSFGPDEYLYISFGDGGSGGDPGDRAQNKAELLGKMLRIDVNGDDFPQDPNRNYAIPPSNPFVGVPDVREEIWATGLRNPWRCSFDRQSGDLYIGDVGQGAREEISFQPGDSPGGLNYGWKCEEGNACFGNSQHCRCGDENLVPPIHDYPRNVGTCVTGGYVYRGSAIPGLDGTYFFADYSNSNIWSFRYDGNQVTEYTVRTTELRPQGFSINNPAGFGEDANGEIYICDHGGEVFKIIANTPPCEDVRRLTGKCTRSGKIKAAVKLTDASHDGRTVVLGIGDDEFNVVVRGKKAKLAECCYNGPQTVSLLAPADCKPPKDVTCPE